MYVFVRRFGGHAFTHDSWQSQMETLESKLLKDKRKFKQGTYYTAGYSSPWDFKERRNEVWMECLEHHDDDHQH